MKKFLSCIILLACLTLLPSCMVIDERFYVRNFEQEPVSVEYLYYPQDNITEVPGFYYQPKSFVLITDSILPKKALRNFPYKGREIFDSLAVSPIDSFRYKFTLPPGNTAYLAPVYQYGDNIQTIILNNTDTILFKSDYPGVEVEDFQYEKIYRQKGIIFAPPYNLLDVRLKEIQEILER